MRALAFFCRETMTALVPSAKEVAMDATFGTNHSGMDLFALLAEFDGSGFPLGYFFVETISVERDRPSVAGALAGIIEQFLQVFKDSGLNPSFFGVDKDLSEIAAIKKVFKNAKIQLCFWHAKRAIRQKMRDASKTQTQAKYSPAEAQLLVPSLEICWGSMPTRRPRGDHFFERCQCPSRAQRFEEKSRLEPLTVEERDSILAMFSRHFNAHPTIPDRNGTFRTPEVIHSESASELYTWCKARGYFRLWAYMFINWYHPNQWNRWARSANPKEIPILKTTMVVESHWRLLKHDFLHRFNRPRIDLVVWIVTSRLIPAAVFKMKAIQSRNYRMATASWRGDFKKEWKELSGRVPEKDSFRKYHTNPQKWVCGCDFFLGSRFLICKHLVHCFEPVTQPLEFFRDVQRQRSTPYWTWANNQLVLRSECASLMEQDAADKGNSTSASECSASEWSEVESDMEEKDQDEDNLVYQDKPEDGKPELDIDQFVLTTRSMLDLVREQYAKGNVKFVERVVRANASNQVLMDEVNQLRAGRTMRCTWLSTKHPATFYYS